jgi:hypothetical protein
MTKQTHLATREEMLALAERLERLNPDRMVGEKGTTFLYSEDVKAIVSALRTDAA